MEKEKKFTRSEQGFTLLEIMVVIVILGMLFAYVGVRVVNRAEVARQDMAGIQIRTLETALKIYKLDNGAYPSSDQGLEALVEAPASGKLAKRFRPGGYLDSSKVPKDPWDNDYIYSCPGEHGAFDIICLGANGEFGGDEFDTDINNWELD